MMEKQKMFKNWNPSTLHTPPPRGQILGLPNPVEDFRVQVEQWDDKNTWGGQHSAATVNLWKQHYEAPRPREAGGNRGNPLRERGGKQVLCEKSPARTLSTTPGWHRSDGRDSTPTQHEYLPPPPPPPPQANLPRANHRALNELLTWQKTLSSTQKRARQASGVAMGPGCYSNRAESPVALLTYWRHMHCRIQPSHDDWPCRA